MIAKIAQATQLTEKYKSIAKTAVDRYISSQAKRLGVSVEDIRSRLNENYSFNDIDKVCESLRDYRRNLSKLPFSVEQSKVAKVTLNENVSITNMDNPDDIIDNDLFNLINN